MLEINKLELKPTQIATFVKRNAIKLQFIENKFKLSEYDEMLQ